MGYIQRDGGSPEKTIGEGNFEIEYAAKAYPVEASLTPLFDPKGERMRI
jgi:glycine cleavage system aminomethyltransferase T